VEDALRLSEAKYRTLVEAPDLSIVTLDRNGTFHFANSNVAENIGVPAEQIIGKTIREFFPKDYVDKHIRELRQALDSKETAVFETQTIVQGREAWREIRIQPLIKPDGSCDMALVIANDITERKTIEEKILSYQKRLRSLTSDLLLTEERERRRIAGELHDRIGQALAISKMKLGALLRESSGGRTSALKEVRALIDQTIRDTRSLTFDLSPPILHELGLEPAVEWLVDRLKEEYGIDATFHDDGRQLLLGDNCRVLLFQSVRELLMNVLRHAQAQRVDVSIRHQGGEIEIETKDDGIGFDASQISLADGGPTGFGLFSIRERLCHLGGQLEIESKPGHGARITLRVPRLVDTGQQGEEPR
jgi:PAS domain S-box-containing protein